MNAHYIPRTRYQIFEPDFHDDQITLTRYKYQNNELIPVHKEYITYGGDPRLVSDGQNAYAIIVGSHFSTVRLSIYDFSTQKLIQVTMPPNFGHPGKNWQPILDNGDLFVVQEMAPFRILKIDVETGVAAVEREVHIELNVSASYDPYTIFRGGSNCIKVGNNFHGIGRITTNQFTHIPYFWSLGGNRQYNYAFTEIFNIFRDYGYNIVDPTCLFFHKNDLYLGVAVSEREWEFSQMVSDYLLCFPKRKNIRHKKTLSEYFSSRVPTKINGKANPERQVFHCTEMMRAETASIESDGVLSSGEGGVLVFGKCLDLVPGKYRALLCYCVKSKHVGQIGAFDVYVHAPETDDMPDQSMVLAAVGFDAQENDNAEAEIVFEVTPEMRGKLEFRVLVNEGVILNAYYIRMWAPEKLPHPDSRRSWVDWK